MHDDLAGAISRTQKVLICRFRIRVEPCLSRYSVALAVPPVVDDQDGGAGGSDFAGMQGSMGNIACVAVEEKRHDAALGQPNEPTMNAGAGIGLKPQVTRAQLRLHTPESLRVPGREVERPIREVVESPKRGHCQDGPCDVPWNANHTPTLSETAGEYSGHQLRREVRSIREVVESPKRGHCQDGPCDVPWNANHTPTLSETAGEYSGHQLRREV